MILESTFCSRGASLAVGLASDILKISSLVIFCTNFLSFTLSAAWGFKNSKFFTLIPFLSAIARSSFIFVAFLSALITFLSSKIAFNSGDGVEKLSPFFIANATLNKSSSEIVSPFSSVKRSPFENSEKILPLFAKSLERLSSFARRKLEFLLSFSSVTNFEIKFSKRFSPSSDLVSTPFLAESLISLFSVGVCNIIPFIETPYFRLL